MFKNSSIHTKFRLYLSFIFIGLILLAAFIFENQQKTKEQITTIYFGSLIPIKELQQMVIILNRDVLLKKLITRIYDEPIDYASELLQSDKEIMRLWKHYAGHWKSEAEKPYIEFLDGEMQKMHTYLIELATLSQDKLIHTQKISLDGLRKTVIYIESHLNNLIGHETTSAHNDREEFIVNHEQRMLISGLFVLFILVLTLVAFLNIQSLKAQLWRTSEDLHKASITDGLTGLYNRRYFDQIFQSELERAKRDRLPVAFMMIDIDHFKKYNDTYGHAMGDDVIKGVAKHLHDYFKRTGDLIFRLGGEEFGVLMHSQSFEAIEKLCKAMLTGMETLHIEHKASDTKPFVTLSAGVSYINTIIENINVTKIYELTDAQLYHSKEHGRNQATIQEVSF